MEEEEEEGRTCGECGIDFWRDGAVENLDRFCVEEEMESSHFEPGWLNKGSKKGSDLGLIKVETEYFIIFHHASEGPDLSALTPYFLPD